VWIKVSVTGPDGRHVETAVDVTEEGEVTEAIGVAIHDYRKLYPEANPFDFAVKVSKD